MQSSSANSEPVWVEIQTQSSPLHPNPLASTHRPCAHIWRARLLLEAAPPLAIAEDAPVILLYTSGTTGVPRGSFTRIAASTSQAPEKTSRDEFRLARWRISSSIRCRISSLAEHRALAAMPLLGVAISLRRQFDLTGCAGARSAATVPPRLLATLSRRSRWCSSHPDAAGTDFGYRGGYSSVVCRLRRSRLGLIRRYIQAGVRASSAGANRGPTRAKRPGFAAAGRNRRNLE